MALDLGRQVGPLPMGAWVAVIGGGLGLGFYITHRQQSAQSTPPEVQTADTGVGAGGGQFVYEPPTSVPVEAPSANVETLGEWVAKAIAYLISKGKSPLAAETAIKKYATGQALSTSEQSLVNEAIAGIGVAPPDELPSVPVLTPAPTPSTPSTAKPVITLSAPDSYTAGKSVTVRGKVTRDGKPVSYVSVSVNRKSVPGASNAWRYYKLVPTRSDGSFAFTAAPVKSGTSFYIRVSYDGATPVTHYFQKRG